MKRQTLLIGAAVMILLLGVGGWFVFRPGNSSVTVQTPDGAGTLEIKTDETKMSISDIMNRGGSVKCIYQAAVSDSGSINNTVYISGKKMRVEALVKDAAGEQRQSTTISDGQYAYVWSDQDKTGMKMAATDDGSGEDSAMWQGQAQYADPNQKMDFQCDAWTVDEAMFIPPSDISFTDFTSIEKTQCAMCDTLSGEQKTTCLTSLGCN